MTKIKAGDKVIFNGGSSRYPIIIRGTVFQGRSEFLVRDERGTVYSTIGWKVEINGDNKEGGDRKDGS